MIDITKMDYHVAARDAQGRPVLIQKPLPAEFATANAVSRLSYRRAVAAEEREVIAAARAANAPAKPANWQNFGAAERLTWRRMAEAEGSKR
jgi:hypothetical protein